MTDTTRQRILESAEPIFADRGFDGASVRAICDAAKANVAAVNYHFGDKHSLYVETVKLAVRSCCDHMRHPEPPADLPPLDRLRLFIDGMVRGMLELPRASAMQLMMREMTSPTDAAAAAVEEFIRPMADRLRAILRPILAPGASDLRLWMIGQSIVGQCLYYRQNRSVAERLMGDDLFRQATADALSAHITAFTLAALGAGPAVTGTEDVA